MQWMQFTFLGKVRILLVCFYMEDSFMNTMVYEAILTSKLILKHYSFLCTVSKKKKTNPCVFVTYFSGPCLCFFTGQPWCRGRAVDL